LSSEINASKYIMACCDGNWTVENQLVGNGNLVIREGKCFYNGKETFNPLYISSGGGSLDMLTGLYTTSTSTMYVPIHLDCILVQTHHVTSSNHQHIMRCPQGWSPKYTNRILYDPYSKKGRCVLVGEFLGHHVFSTCITENVECLGHTQGITEYKVNAPPTTLTFVTSFKETESVQSFLGPNSWTKHVRLWKSLWSHVPTIIPIDPNDLIVREQNKQIRYQLYELFCIRVEKDIFTIPTLIQLQPYLVKWIYNKYPFTWDNQRIYKNALYASNLWEYYKKTGDNETFAPAKVKQIVDQLMERGLDNTVGLSDVFSQTNNYYTNWCVKQAVWSFIECARDFKLGIDEDAYFEFYNNISFPEGDKFDDLYTWYPIPIAEPLLADSKAFESYSGLVDQNNYINKIIFGLLPNAWSLLTMSEEHMPSTWSRVNK